MNTDPLHAATDRLVGLIWPIAAAIVVTGILRIATVLYCRHAGMSRRSSDLIGYLVAAAALLLFAYGWTRYILPH